MAIKTALRRLLRNRDSATRMRSLEATAERRGSMLLSYVIDPFWLDSEADISRDHTHHWESWQIAQIFRQTGFDVDVVHYDDRKFVPAKSYDVLVSARTQLERLSKRLPSTCFRVAHLDTAHWLTNNSAAYRRLLACRDRTGKTLHDTKLIEQNWAIENADVGCVLGNDWTAGTYAFAGKPMHRIPISAPAVYDWGQDKDVEKARRNFLWFGSSGFVHKGLDLVLEAFAGLPECQLFVCGPFDAEPRFTTALRPLLYEQENIIPEGWVDVAGERFREIASQCIGLVYPSCAEGGGASAITCMHAGVIPIVTPETSIDTPGFGVQLTDPSVEQIRAAVRNIASLPGEELARQSTSAWAYARTHHTRQGFARAYRDFVENTVVPAVDERRRSH